jgi:Zn-dependent peptidase ImmA (M78 family)
MVNSQIEEKATQILRKCRVSTAPVNILKMAQMLGAKVGFQPFREELSGMLVRKDDQIIIGVNSRHPKTRQRFTIAHELGHWQLGHQGELFLDKTLRSRSVSIKKRDQRAAEGTDKEEIDANAFAAAILMPESLLIAAVERRLRGDDGYAIDRLVGDLAGEFEVSSQAMEHRLTNLGMMIPS